MSAYASVGAIMGVRTMSIRTLVTVTPWWRHSREAMRPKASSAALAAVYAANFGAIICTPHVSTFTTWPSPRSIMPGASPIVSRTGPKKLIAISLSKSWKRSNVPVSDRRIERPALLTRMSTPPAASTSAISPSMAVMSDRSQTEMRACPPASAISAATRCSSSRRRATSHTSAPRSASALAVASPMPDEPPVTSTRLPISGDPPRFLTGCRGPSGIDRSAQPRGFTRRRRTGAARAP